MWDNNNVEYNKTNKEEEVRNKHEAVVLHTAGNKRNTNSTSKSISTTNSVLTSKINRKVKEENGQTYNKSERYIIIGTDRKLPKVNSERNNSKTIPSEIDIKRW